MMYLPKFLFHLFVAIILQIHDRHFHMCQVNKRRSTFRFAT